MPKDRRSEDDVLVEQACGLLSLSKFEFFDRALLWEKGSKNSSTAALDYNVYEQSNAYPPYVLAYANEIVRMHRTDDISNSAPFKNVRSLHARRSGEGTPRVIDLNSRRGKKPRTP